MGVLTKEGMGYLKGIGLFFKGWDHSPLHTMVYFFLTDMIAECFCCFTIITQTRKVKSNEILTKEIERMLTSDNTTNKIINKTNNCRIVSHFMQTEVFF